VALRKQGTFWRCVDRGCLLRGEGIGTIQVLPDPTGQERNEQSYDDRNPVDIDEGSEEIAQPGAGMTPPVGLGAGEAMPTEAVGQPGVAGSYPSGRVASASSPEVVSGNATPLGNGWQGRRTRSMLLPPRRRRTAKFATPWIAILPSLNRHYVNTWTNKDFQMSSSRTLRCGCPQAAPIPSTRWSAGLFAVWKSRWASGCR
jgi:hypothetical protein